MKKKILISIVMGSQSDWKTLVNCEEILKNFDVSYEKKLFLHIGLQNDFMNMQKILKTEVLKLLLLVLEVPLIFQE